MSLKNVLLSSKGILLSTVGAVAVAAVAIGGTLAYLTSTDNDVNVMTLGNVSIAQHEYERATNTDGSFETKEIDGVTSYVLKDFTQGKPLLPSALVTNGPGWDWDSTIVRMTQVDSYGGMDVFKAASNAQDKFVTVENTGKTDAYIRTLVAIEIGSADGSLIGTSYHSTWNKTEIGEITIDGNTYVLFEYAYEGGELTDGTWRHQYGILPAGDTSYPNLSQVYISAAATNEDMVKLDGNGNGTLDILVLSQAVQAAGFDSASTALDTAFGKSSEKAAEWFGGVIAEHSADTWDGTVDTSWYDPANPLNKYEISTAEQLAGLAELVSGNTTFKGVTFTLVNDFDLYCEDTSEYADGDPVTFRPIGDKSKNGTFEGTFDGNGKTISNLYQNGWDLGYQSGVYGSYGLFGNVNNATIKNLTLSGGESYIEGGDTSFVAGSATGTCVFENITIEDSVSATYNNGNGGIIGWSGAGNYTFKNITIAEDCVLAGLWGSFDSSIGGIVGQGEPGATYNFDNVDIACRIDAYNDCTASYDYYNYRMCGMIIGRLEETTTIDGSNYPDTSKYNITCSNVTVTYGDWMNYHYCDPTPGYNNGRGMRVEPGYSYDGLPADYDHSQCTTHHNELIPFDQIFGGAQYGVKGLKTYDGVTIVYPNN